MNKFYKSLQIFLFVFSVSPVFTQTAEKPNIILIMSDDLNDYVQGLNGHTQTTTPNIANLAAQGTIFLNAFSNGVQCKPSRASMLTGKQLEYTDIHANDQFVCSLGFRGNLDPGKYFTTLPQYLKDSGGYYTVTMNKIFHCDGIASDYDDVTLDPCAKELSWNQHVDVGNINGIKTDGDAQDEDISNFFWAKIDSAYAEGMEDYRITDSAITFLDQYSTDPSSYCDKPFFLAVGYHRPHQSLYIPEQYFLDGYLENEAFSEDLFHINYNTPENAYPYNGVVMPPQPEVWYSDYDSLNLVGQALAHPVQHNAFYTFAESIPLPEIDPSLSDAERLDIVARAKMANAVMAYLAAIRFVDEQVGRLMEGLAEHPELYNNSIIIFTSDHGYSLGEKKHWLKSTLWESVIRIPLVIVDLRNPEPAVCNRTVSLIDLFPTICSFAEIPFPETPDGDPYLDGISLSPLLNQPNKRWERPALSSFKNEVEKQGACFPQHSVRSEAFHYIQYASNNAGSLIPCNETLSEIEQELYEIGINKEIDPNEWNNLANNPDYADMMAYLSEFLPDGDMYLQTAHNLDIRTPPLPCLINKNHKLKLKAKLFHPDGSMVPAAAYGGYTFSWSNNLTSATSNSMNVNFHMSTIPLETFIANDYIIFYLSATDTLTGKRIAFTQKRFAINPLHAPSATYDLSLDANALNIEDYNLSGHAEAATWDFGDGVSVPGFAPATHVYTEIGSQLLTHTLLYGNGCQVQYVDPISIDSLIYRKQFSDYHIYPNPANEVLHVQLNGDTSIQSLDIIRLTGQLVLHMEMDPHSTQNLQIDTHTLPNGLYYVRMNSYMGSSVKAFEVIH